MFSRLVWLCLLACFFSSLFANAAATKSAQRDDAAVALVQKSVIAMKGDTNVPNGYAVQLSEQGKRATDGAQSASISIYQYLDGSLSFTNTTTTVEGISTFSSGGGVPQLTAKNGHLQQYNSAILMTVLPYDYPALILALELANPNVAITSVSADPGGPVHLRTEDDSSDFTQSVTTQDWYFDPVTNLPIRVEYKLQNAATGEADGAASCDYIGFQSFSGVLLPASIRSFESQNLVSTITMSQVILNPVLPPSFDVQVKK